MSLVCRSQSRRPLAPRRAQRRRSELSFSREKEKKEMVWHATKLPTVQSLPIHAKIIAQNALLRKESEPHKMQRQLNNSAVPSKAAAAAARWGCATPRRSDRGHDVEQATQGKERPFFSKEENKKSWSGSSSMLHKHLLKMAAWPWKRIYLRILGQTMKANHILYCNDVNLQIYSMYILRT